MVTVEPSSDALTRKRFKRVDSMARRLFLARLRNTWINPYRSAITGGSILGSRQSICICDSPYAASISTRTSSIIEVRSRLVAAGASDGCSSSVSTVSRLWMSVRSAWKSSLDASASMLDRFR